MSPWRICRLINNVPQVIQSRPGFCGLPFCIHFSLAVPPFHCLVVKPSISTFTPHRSKVLAKISALIAAIVIGRPRIDPELSISKETTVSLNSVSFSILYERGYKGAVTTLESRPASKIPSSKSNNQERFCCASNFRCSLLANLPIRPCRWFSC